MPQSPAPAWLRLDSPRKRTRLPVAKSNCLQRSDLGQRTFDFFDAFKVTRALAAPAERQRIPLKNQSALDAGARLLGERLVQAPQFALSRHGCAPIALVTEFIEFNALPWRHAGWACHPTDAANQHYAGWNMRDRRIPAYAPAHG